MLGVRLRWFYVIVNRVNDQTICNGITDDCWNSDSMLRMLYFFFFIMLDCKKKKKICDESTVCQDTNRYKTIKMWVLHTLNASHYYWLYYSYYIFELSGFRNEDIGSPPNCATVIHSDASCTVHYLESAHIFPIHFVFKSTASKLFELKLFFSFRLNETSRRVST